MPAPLARSHPSRAARPRVRALRRLAPALLATALAACAGGRPHPVAAPAPRTAGGAAIAPVGVAAVGDDERAYARSRQLVMPVAGARAAKVADSYTDPRSGGRTHYAVDVMAPRGTPVLAADDGRIWKLRQGGIGGIALYALDPAQRIVYYYAHLDRYHPGLAEGMPIQRGDTLGYVGTTGNAPADAPHLHFQVAFVNADRRYWTGLPVNPLPLLREAEQVRLAAREPSERPTRDATRELGRDRASREARGAAGGSGGAGRTAEVQTVARRGGAVRPTVPVLADDTLGVETPRR